MDIYGKEQTMRRNLAARAGHWSAAHWKTATFGWLALVVAAVLLGSLFGSRSLSDVETSNGETARAERILADAGIDAPASESVLVQSRTAKVDAPALQRTVQVCARPSRSGPRSARSTRRSPRRMGAPCSSSST
jgi:hypothetical protein